MFLAIAETLCGEPESKNIKMLRWNSVARGHAYWQTLANIYWTNIVFLNE